MSPILSYYPTMLEAPVDGIVVEVEPSCNFPEVFSQLISDNRCDKMDADMKAKVSQWFLPLSKSFTHW